MTILTPDGRAVKSCVTYHNSADPESALLVAHQRVVEASVAELVDLLLTATNDWPRTEATLIARLAAARLAGLALGVAA